MEHVLLYLFHRTAMAGVKRVTKVHKLTGSHGRILGGGGGEEAIPLNLYLMN
jgi:hypothetical protein